MNVKIKRLSPTAIIPTRASEGSAGYDLYLFTEDGKGVDINPGDHVILHTGVAMAIPDGYFGAIYARSGLAIKKGIRPANCVGVIDSDYRGELLIGIHADGDEPIRLEATDRIAQIVIQKYEKVHFEVVDDLDDTDRGEGGLGSTGGVTNGTDTTSESEKSESTDESEKSEELTEKGTESNNGSNF